MPDVLTLADLAAIRHEWIGDEIDLHPEWGTAPHVGTPAFAGAASLTVAGLGTGTLKRGTPFLLFANGVATRYTVAAASPIAAGAATVSLSSLLEQPAQAGDTITVEPLRRSLYNRVHNRLLFSDVDLQDFGDQAHQRYTHRIQTANDPTRALYQAVALFAFRAMLLPGSEFRQALAIADPTRQGAVELESLEARVRELEAGLGGRALGPVTVWLER